MKKKSLAALILAISMCLLLPILSYATVLGIDPMGMHGDCPLKIFGQEILHMTKKAS